MSEKSNYPGFPDSSKDGPAQDCPPPSVDQASLDPVGEAVERLTASLGRWSGDFKEGPVEDLRTLLAAYAEMKESLAVSQELHPAPVDQTSLNPVAEAVGRLLELGQLLPLQPKYLIAARVVVAENVRLKAELDRLRAPGAWRELMATDARRVLGDPTKGVFMSATGELSR